MSRTVVRCADASDVARRAAALVSARIAASRGTFSLVLAGGSTPKRAYELLAADRSLEPHWTRVHVWFGDERCVAPDAPESNYAMAKAALFDRVAIPAANVHRVPGELGAGPAADAYEAELRRATPWFDFVLLGLGEDGHTASLFPGHAALAAGARLAVPVETEAKAPRWRVSLTLPALSSGAEAAFLVTGEGKRAVLTEILAGAASAMDRYPAARIAAARGVTWIADAAALGGTAS